MGSRVAIRGRGAAAIHTLLGSVSVAVLAATVPAIAQPAPPIQAAANMVPEQVLVTGSLIHGAAAVGVPVTTLSEQDYNVVGAATTSELLATQPSVLVYPDSSYQVSPSNISRQELINIHNLGLTRTLLMVDGIRVPPGNFNATGYDPSVLPDIAIDHVDILADGASATYGSDAVAGVVNLALIRGFDGAITKALFSTTTQGGDTKVEAEQLWGRKWDSGDITVSYQYLQQFGLKASQRPNLFTYNFTPWGLNDTTPTKAAVPGLVTINANPSVSSGSACTNCYSIPNQNGQNLTWAQIVSNQGDLNEVNPYLNATVLPPQQKNAATLTFDQNITSGIQLFAEGYYSDRRLQAHQPVGQSRFNANIFTLAVPTTNPYYPSGAPAGLRVTYDIGQEIQPLVDNFEVSDRAAAGFNLALPFGWSGKIFYDVNEEHNVNNWHGLLNPNNLTAAVGNTAPATPAIGNAPAVGSFVKPSNVPYLNLFCNPLNFVCNDPATLAYIESYYIDDESLEQQEAGASFDGALFALPGGDVRAAVGGDYRIENFRYSLTANDGVHAANAFPSISSEGIGRTIYAFFGQLNIPLVGDANAIPLIRDLSLEASLRYDNYSTFGGTTNPKVGLNWTAIEGLVFRGSWGTSFAAPNFADLSAYTGKTVQQQNVAAGASTNGSPACTTIGGAPAPGSVAAILNPACSSALQYPGGLTQNGGYSVLVGVTRPANYTMSPETATNYSFGFEFSPSTGFGGVLRGLDLIGTYYHTVITNEITAPTADLNNPAERSFFCVKGDPCFTSALAAYLASPVAPANVPSSSIQWLFDGAFRNLGSETQSGIDFSASYDADLGALGAWNTGLTGNYALKDTTVLIAGTTPTDPTVGSIAVAGLGNATEPRMRIRGRLGWADTNGLSVTGFVNYTAHYFSTQAYPPSTALTAFPHYNDMVPSFYTFDLSLGYDLGAQPASPYLQNIQFQLVVNNLLDRHPPFVYRVAVSGGTTTFDGTMASPDGRVVALTITKRW